MKKQLQVMKFGGTSVGDASCIARVCEIVKEASRDHSILVVVSAMSGVTNRLIEAATRAEAGERDNAALLIDALRKQHDVALNALIHDPETRKRLSARIEELLKEATRLCDGTALIRELTPRTLDSVSSLGERLSAPLVAAALKECGVETEAVEATELIVTDGYHGAAEPAIERTRERCEVRLRPLLQKEIVPVVTGFIGATPEGVLTTLGRGGSDYSATILGAAISADEIIIWTDVNGVLSADPRLVPEARTIPEISYREAAELQPGGPAAYFASLPIKAAVAALRQAGLPAAVSNSAGTFLCNHVFYGLMHEAASREQPFRGGFLHVPYLPSQAAQQKAVPSMALEQIVEGIEIILSVSAARVDDLAVSEGAIS